jgi:hypothetical protein
VFSLRALEPLLLLTVGFDQVRDIPKSYVRTIALVPKHGQFKRRMQEHDKRNLAIVCFMYMMYTHTHTHTHTHTRWTQRRARSQAKCEEKRGLSSGS